MFTDMEQLLRNVLKSNQNMENLDFLKMFYSCLEDESFLNDFRAYMKQYMFHSLKKSKLKPVTEPTKTIKQQSVSPKMQSLNLLIADYLLRQDFFYTLSVFSSEAPFLNNLTEFSSYIDNLANKHLCKDKDSAPKFLSSDVKDILECLGLSPYSEESIVARQLYMECDQGEPLILCLIKAVVGTLQNINRCPACRSVYEDSKISHESDPIINLDLNEWQTEICNQLINYNIRSQQIQTILHILTSCMNKEFESYEKKMELIFNEKYKQLEIHEDNLNEKIKQAEHHLIEQRENIEKELIKKENQLKNANQNLQRKKLNITKAVDILQKQKDILDEREIELKDKIIKENQELENRNKEIKRKQKEVNKMLEEMKQKTNKKFNEKTKENSRKNSITEVNHTIVDTYDNTTEMIDNKERNYNENFQNERNKKTIETFDNNQNGVIDSNNLQNIAKLDQINKVEHFKDIKNKKIHENNQIVINEDNHSNIIKLKPINKNLQNFENKKLIELNTKNEKDLKDISNKYNNDKILFIEMKEQTKLLKSMQQQNLNLMKLLNNKPDLELETIENKEDSYVYNISDNDGDVKRSNQNFGIVISVKDQKELLKVMQEQNHSLMKLLKTIRTKCKLIERNKEVLCSTDNYKNRSTQCEIPYDTVSFTNCSCLSTTISATSNRNIPKNKHTDMEYSTKHVSSRKIYGTNSIETDNRNGIHENEEDSVDELVNRSDKKTKQIINNAYKQYDSLDNKMNQSNDESNSKIYVKNQQGDECCCFKRRNNQNHSLNTHESRNSKNENDFLENQKKNNSSVIRLENEILDLRNQIVNRLDEIRKLFEYNQNDEQILNLNHKKRTYSSAPNSPKFQKEIYSQNISSLPSSYRHHLNKIPLEISQTLNSTTNSDKVIEQSREILKRLEIESKNINESYEQYKKRQNQSRESDGLTSHNSIDIKPISSTTFMETIIPKSSYSMEDFTSRPLSSKTFFSNTSHYNPHYRSNLFSTEIEDSSSLSTSLENSPKRIVRSYFQSDLPFWKSFEKKLRDRQMKKSHKENDSPHQENILNENDYTKEIRNEMKNEDNKIHKFMSEITNTSPLTSPLKENINNINENISNNIQLNEYESNIPKIEVNKATNSPNQHKNINHSSNKSTLLRRFNNDYNNSNTINNDTHNITRKKITSLEIESRKIKTILQSIENHMNQNEHKTNFKDKNKNLENIINKLNKINLIEKQMKTNDIYEEIKNINEINNFKTLITKQNNLEDQNTECIEKDNNKYYNAKNISKDSNLDNINENQFNINRIKETNRPTDQIHKSISTQVVQEELTPTVTAERGGDTKIIENNIKENFNKVQNETEENYLSKEINTDNTVDLNENNNAIELNTNENFTNKIQDNSYNDLKEISKNSNKTNSLNSETVGSINIESNIDNNIRNEIQESLNDIQNEIKFSEILKSNQVNRKTDVEKVGVNNIETTKENNIEIKKTNAIFDKPLDISLDKIFIKENTKDIIKNKSIEENSSNKFENENSEMKDDINDKREAHMNLDNKKDNNESFNKYSNEKYKLDNEQLNTVEKDYADSVKEDQNKEKEIPSTLGNQNTTLSVNDNVMENNENLIVEYNTSGSLLFQIQDDDFWN